MLNRKIFEYKFDGDAPRAARVYAVAMVAQHDAILACWDAKYVYLEQRPNQADPTITPQYATPTHPGYPSGHACAGGSLGAARPICSPQIRRTSARWECKRVCRRFSPAFTRRST